MIPRILVVLVILAVPATTRACSTPVFRYALERWVASPYQCVVFHAGPLSPDQQKIVDGLEDAKPPRNVRVVTVDTREPIPAGIAKLWQAKPTDAALPWVAIVTPDADPNASPMWSGPLKEEALRPLWDSPTRQVLFKALMAGDSGVFLLLESGKESEDQAAAAFLAEELPKLEKAITLPKPAADDPPPLTKLPLAVKFRVLRLSRADAAEAGFVKMLLACDEDFPAVKGPLVLAVFGRGRLLGGLHDTTLTPASLRRVAEFLCGACSCRVKELNPGVDLLLSADWDAALEAAGKR